MPAIINTSTGQRSRPSAAYLRNGREGAQRCPSVREVIMSTSKRRARASAPEMVAGNGLIDRRVLLGRGIAIAGAVGTGAGLTGAAAEPLRDEKWSLEFGSIMPPVQTASKYEKDVARSLSNPN